MAKVISVLGLPFRAGLIWLFRAYRAVGGGSLSGRCRFYPSCSRFGEAAVREHGAVKGIALATWRILRCNPFSSGGVEHVPPKGSWRGLEYDNVARSGVS